MGRVVGALLSTITQFVNGSESKSKSVSSCDANGKHPSLAQKFNIIDKSAGDRSRYLYLARGRDEQEKSFLFIMAVKCFAERLGGNLGGIWVIWGYPGHGMKTGSDSINIEMVRKWFENGSKMLAAQSDLNLCRK